MLNRYRLAPGGAQADQVPELADQVGGHLEPAVYSCSSIRHWCGTRNRRSCLPGNLGHLDIDQERTIELDPAVEDPSRRVGPLRQQLKV